MATHNIVEIELSNRTTKAGGKMWHCTCATGERVNAFESNNLAHDTTHLFEQSGWWPEIAAMVPGQKITFKNSPIPVSMEKDGQYWGIITVEPRPNGAAPDPVYVPDHSLWKPKARTWARIMLDPNLALPVVFWDTETTGVDANAEITSIAIYSSDGECIFASLIRPDDMSRFDTETGREISEKTGIYAETVAAAPRFPEVYEEIAAALEGNIWVIYNKVFDTQILTQVCDRHKLPQIASAGVNCAMEHYAMYHGAWHPVSQRYSPQSLSEACNQMGIVLENAHDATADTLATLELVRAMARLD